MPARQQPGGLSMRAVESLLLFAKAPVAGDVKTRLHDALGPEGASDLYRGLLQDTLDTMVAVRRVRPSVETVVRVAGDGSLEGFDLGGARLLPQLASGDLGARLLHGVRAAIEAGARAVVAIGADSPTLPAEYVVQAFASVSDARIVLGPSSDGGYYLIGTCAAHEVLFRDVPWSTGEVLAATIEAARGAGLDVLLLPEWYDVDTAEDLERLRADLDADPVLAPHTRERLGRP